MVLNNGLGVSLVGIRIEIWQKEGSEGNLSSAWDHFCFLLCTQFTLFKESKIQENSIYSNCSIHNNKNKNSVYFVIQPNKFMFFTWLDFMHVKNQPFYVDDHRYFQVYL